MHSAVVAYLAIHIEEVEGEQAHLHDDFLLLGILSSVGGRQCGSVCILPPRAPLDTFYSHSGMHGREKNMHKRNSTTSAYNSARYVP